MKIKIVPALIAIALSGVFTYAVYATLDPMYTARIPFIILVAIAILLPLLSGFGVDYANNKTTTGIKVLSIVFGIIAIVVAFILAATSARLPISIILLTLVSVIYFAILYKLSGIKDI